ncbi:3'(2'),5'-bisphosphate nucleotidase [Terracoccus luteus]|uniref:3'(2'),5-bisphosphonucleoside 3'(2')-phosphohydrolase n=1 Tax=Terracoccus luteus TaxID=53356 RepID=A0A495XZ73_9MICO|nr:3'(2'),5'-bisphosphate nucleotidase CysQ [Terracoccus luteus]RKT78465.1 3'(2'),5'-bisphosphate nucleotidase [Terracoccus luteus]
MDDSMDDHDVARTLAEGAGQVLLRLRTRLDDPASLKAEGDRGAHEYLVRELARLRPDDAVLSEEGKDDPVRLTADRVWIVDPLDGTREYSEKPRDDWAVHVALWERGELVAGAVARPARGRSFTTGEPAPVPDAGEGPLRLAVSRSRPPAFVNSLAERLGAELVPMGSAGIKATALLDGVVDAYVHAGGQYEWDSAAPVAVALASGLHASRIDGSPLRYNQPDPLLPDLLICRPQHAGLLLDTVSSLIHEDATP